MKNLLMIPAMGCDARLYAELKSGLSPFVNVSVVMADKDNLGQCVAQVMAMAPDRFAVLGTSFGGRLALEITLAEPTRVEGLVVIGAGSGVAADPAAGFTRATCLRGNEFETVVAEMAAMISHFPGPHGPKVLSLFVEMARASGGELMACQSEALAKRVDLGPRLVDITCPSLMLWGRQDKFSPALDGLHMSTAIPQARYAEISDCGHFPSVEAPEETLEILLHWLRDVGLISG
jgi:pimeloyl-ACP methyl ester carboxylesterase